MRVLLCVFSILINYFQPIPYVKAESSCYAQIVQNGCYLYRNPSDNSNYTNIYFMIENTYFVELLSDYDENFYKAKYMDIIGYVKKNQVQCVQGTPRNPFLENISFRVFGNISREMYDKPYYHTNNPSLKIYLPLYCEDLIYYGIIYGESAVEERTNIWYYCKYTVTNEYGYVYSDSCDKMSTIIKNTEKLAYISSPQWEQVAPTSAQLVSVDSNPFKITTALICIPFATFIILLIKFAYSKSQNNKKEIDTFDSFK